MEKLLSRKRIGWIVGSAIFGAVIILFSFYAAPHLNLAVRLVMMCGVVASAGVWSLTDKFESIPMKLLFAFVGRFGMWLFMGYLLYSQLRWEYSLVLATILSLLDWRTIYRARERKLDKLNAQNLPPMSFRP